MPPARSRSHFPAGAAFGPAELAASEVKQLWWLLDGAIMAPDVRDAQDARRVNERPRFAALIAAARPLIQTHACPQCLGGDGLVCRPHLLAGVQPSPDLAGALAQLAGRVRAYVRSTTVDGALVDALGRFAWIEALGWSAGWDLPSRLPEGAAA